MKVQRPVGNDVDGITSLETVRIYLYALKDPISQEVRYIGQTVDPGNRYRNHIYEAKKNKRTHKELWILSLLRKNQMPVMEIILEDLLTKDEANSMETELISMYSNLTNQEDRARNNPVIITTLVYQFELDGTFIKCYPNANQARLETGVNDAAIGEVCRNPFKIGNNSRGGFMWSYTPKPNKPYELPKDSSKVTEQYSKTGVLLATFPSAREASKATGVCYKRISASITGRQKTAGGYIWKINEDMA